MAGLRESVGAAASSSHHTSNRARHRRTFDRTVKVVVRWHHVVVAVATDMAVAMAEVAVVAVVRHRRSSHRPWGYVHRSRVPGRCVDRHLRVDVDAVDPGVSRGNVVVRVGHGREVLLS
jgi:hypothetical protein